MFRGTQGIRTGLETRATASYKLLCDPNDPWRWTVALSAACVTRLTS